MTSIVSKVRLREGCRLVTTNLKNIEWWRLTSFIARESGGVKEWCDAIADVRQVGHVGVMVVRPSNNNSYELKQIVDLERSGFARSKKWQLAVD
jgi:hypothetical protein